MKWLIYGANGYTGELIAREARARGLTPVLAGRSLDRIKPLAEELGLECRSFSLSNPTEVDKALDGIDLVLHCAGPFIQTSAAMIEGCLRCKVHYLDITGEIPVFEHTHAQHFRAKEQGVVLCSGVGFDVIPTDCVAKALKEALPDATHLALGFEQPAVLSPGTAKTTLELLGKGCMIRRRGQLTAVPLAHASRQIDFGNGMKSAMTIPWGDVATAYYTTGIPNIEVYIPASAGTIFSTRLANLVLPLLRLKPVVAFLSRLISKHVKGPSHEVRNRMSTYVWGQAVNDRGDKATARVKTASGYALTVTGSLAVVQHLFDTRVPAGFYTPASLMGSRLVSILPGSSPILFSKD